MDARERVQLSASRLHPGPAFFQADQYLSIVKGTEKALIYQDKKVNFMKSYFIGQKAAKLTKQTELLFSAISVERCKVL